MEDTNQILIPETFQAIYKSPRTGKLTVAWPILLERYEYCEDLSNMLVETASNMMHSLHITEDDVFDRVHMGLTTPESRTNPEESYWVLQRLAELMRWHGSLESYRPMDSLAVS